MATDAYEDETGFLEYTLEVRAFGHILLGFGTTLCCCIWFIYDRSNRNNLGNKLDSMSKGYRLASFWTFSLIFQIIQCISSIYKFQVEFEEDGATSSTQGMAFLANMVLTSQAVFSLGFAIDLYNVLPSKRDLAKKLEYYLVIPFALVAYGATLFVTFGVSYDLGEGVGFVLLFILKFVLLGSFISFYIKMKNTINKDNEKEVELLSNVLIIVIFQSISALSQIFIALFGTSQGWLLGLGGVLHYLPVTSFFRGAIYMPLILLIENSKNGGNGDNNGGNGDEVRFEKVIRFFKDRLEEMFVPIQVIERRNVKQVKQQGDEADGRQDIESVILVRPEAFRMIFYFLFCSLILLGIWVSTTFSSTFSETDNPVLLLFGNNNLCIYFDFPPFTYFSAFLYAIIVNFVLIFEVLDIIRTYDCYRDDKVFGKGFFIMYGIATLYESIAFLYFIQIFATQPTEPSPAIYVHVLPFINLIIALWTLAFKRYMYYYVTREINETMVKNKYVNALGVAYVVSLGVVIAIKVPFMVINLFGGYLWKQDGWEWTSELTGIVDKLFTFLVIVAPLIMYFFVGQNVRGLIFTINRESLTDRAQRRKNKK